MEGPGFHEGGACFLLVTNCYKSHSFSTLSRHGPKNCPRTPSKALKSEEQILSSELLLLLSGGVAYRLTKVF